MEIGNIGEGNLLESLTDMIRILLGFMQTCNSQFSYTSWNTYSSCVFSHSPLSRVLPIWTSSCEIEASCEWPRETWYSLISFSKTSVFPCMRRVTTLLQVIISCFLNEIRWKFYRPEKTPDTKKMWNPNPLGVNLCINKAQEINPF